MAAASVGAMAVRGTGSGRTAARGRAPRVRRGSGVKRGPRWQRTNLALTFSSEPASLFEKNRRWFLIGILHLQTVYKFLKHVFIMLFSYESL
jgi:hypothetical protein